MRRYIDADLAQAIADTELSIEDAGTVQYVLQHTITADVYEVKHGYWIDTTEYCGELTCSMCKETICTNKYKYCPHCGAKMNLRGVIIND